LIKYKNELKKRKLASQSGGCDLEKAFPKKGSQKCGKKLACYETLK